MEEPDIIAVIGLTVAALLHDTEDFDAQAHYRGELPKLQ